MPKLSNQLPEKFVEKLITFVPQEKLQNVLDGFATPHTTTFRVNTLKISTKEATQQLASLEFNIEHFLWYRDGFMLLNKSKTELMNTYLYKEGKIYIQNASSMIPALTLNPHPEEIILDMAASPGSKTTQIATFMHNTGSIIANDKSPKRLFKLIDNLKNQSVTNVETSAMPGEFLWKKYPEHFDKVLVDAPCTMEGRFNLQDENSYEDWSPRKVKELSNLQKWMLRSAISCTKVGGSIVYSTCAISPEENEEVVDYILKKVGDAVVLEKIEIPYLETDAGLTHWKNKYYSHELSKTLRIYPSAVMEGFFVAKFKKLAPTV